MDRDAPPTLIARQQLADLAALLQTSKCYPFAAKTGALLAQRYPGGSPTDQNIDSLLSQLQHRYQSPVPHAYLSETIAKLQGQRRQHGAFYTPWPLAQYLMRSAAEIVTQEFPSATPTFLDPACGGGIFLQAAPPRSTAAAFIAWDNSSIARELAKAIVDAHDPTGIESSIELCDALQFTPDEREWGADSQPLIVVGNPPYSNFGKRTASGWLHRELSAYRPARGERKTNLRDAFLLFLRLAQSLILRRGQGAIAMVLSTTFLEAVTHAEVRQSLRNTFDELRILRLQSQGAGPDENVFSIRHPTAACIFLRRAGGSDDRQGQVWQAELTGARDEKLVWLGANSASTTPWQEFSSSELAAEQGRGGWTKQVTAPNWYIVAPPLNVIFREYISGVQSKNDACFLARTRSELEAKIRQRFGRFEESFVQPILVAPFDPWWIYYDPSLLGRARHSVMRHMLADNLGLAFMRQATGTGEYDHFLVTRHLVTDRVLHSRWGAPFLAPLYLQDQFTCAPNLSTEVDLSLRERNGSGIDLAPNAWLAYAYALVHSHWYRSRAGEALRRDFPRIPDPKQFSKESVEQLVHLGKVLIELHAPQAGFTAFQSGDETPSPFEIAFQYPKAARLGDEVRILANREQCIASVLPDVWHYRIGGVEVLRRFLMRRRRSALLAWEIAHFQNAAHRIEDTIQIRDQINAISLGSEGA